MRTLRLFLTGLILMCMSSCVVARTPGEYDVVYYDYVITGLVNEPGFVNDGYRSYHLVGGIPRNVYWVLRPVGREVYIYNKQRTYRQIYKPDKHWIYYNKSRQRQYTPPRHHHHTRPVGTHRPPHNNHRHRR